VVNHVVKAVFRPGLLTRRNPVNARAARLSGLRLFRLWMEHRTLPKRRASCCGARKKLRTCALLVFFDRGHSLGSLFPPPAAVASPCPPLRQPIPGHYSRPPIGALPRNCLAYSAAGSASAISPAPLHPVI